MNILTLERPIRSVHPAIKAVNKKTYIKESISYVKPADVLVGFLNFSEDKILSASPYLCELTGYSNEELQQMKFVHLVHPDYRKFVEEKKSTVFCHRNDSYHLVIKARQKSGGEYWADFNISTVYFKNRKSLIAIIFNLSEKQKALELLANTNGVD